MLSLKELSNKHVTSVSVVVAIASIFLTLLPFRKSTETVERTSIQVFNVAHNDGLRDTQLLTFGADEHTNRTIWETVSTQDLQAGLERVEVGAWIPPHSHLTEEILLVYAGRGEAYDENGHVKELCTGSMVHVRRLTRHAFRNVGSEPLWLMWVFPRKSTKEAFQFEQNYNTA